MKIKPISFENSVNIFSGSFNTRRKVLNDTHLKLWRANRPGNKFQKCLYKTKTVNPNWKHFQNLGNELRNAWNESPKSNKGRRHSRDLHGEEDYDQSMKMISISSNFTDEIQNHHDSSEADVLRPSKRIPSKILQIEAAATIHVQNLWKNSFRQL